MIFLKFNEKCSTEFDCVNLFIEIHYRNNLHCTICKQTGKISLKKNTPKNFQCNNCNKSFSVFRDTILLNLHIDFRKWLYAFYLLVSKPKCITANQLAKEIDVSYKTAWHLISQLKKTLRDSTSGEFVGTIIEMNDKIINSYLITKS